MSVFPKGALSSAYNGGTVFDPDASGGDRLAWRPGLAGKWGWRSWIAWRRWPNSASVRENGRSNRVERLASFA